MDLALQDSEEAREIVRGILSQVTAYIDDVEIHMTSNKPDTMVDLRMQLSRHGLDTLENQPVLCSTFLSIRALKHKKETLEERYARMATKIKEYKWPQT